MAKNGAISMKSPLKGKPLRLPGQSLDEEIDYWLNDRFVDYAASLVVYS
jgi:hypothetical protein